MIPIKDILIFLKNFLEIRFDTVEKLSIINLSSYSSKSYVSVVLSDLIRNANIESNGCLFHCS